MIETLTTVWREAIGVLFDPGHFLSLFPLFVAFCIAFVMVVVRLRRKTGSRRLSPRRIMVMLFPHRVFLHKSARLD